MAKNIYKQQILELRKGKRKLSVNSYDTADAMQKKLQPNEYLLFWRVAAEMVVYIDSENIITGPMTERVFDTIDTVKSYGTI